jgi:hypothetical protein
LAVVAGSWAVEATELGRLAALALLAVFAPWRYPEGNEGDGALAHCSPHEFVRE